MIQWRIVVAICSCCVPSSRILRSYACGSYGHNSTDDNISAVNLLNIKKLGRRRNNMQWFKIPSKIYFERDSIEYLHQMKEIHKAIIVTDRSMVQLGYVDKITDQLKLNRNEIQYQLFCDVEPVLTWTSKATRISTLSTLIKKAKSPTTTSTAPCATCCAKSSKWDCDWR